MISTAQKKQVVLDWANEFSGLSIHSQNKLFKIIGAFIIGIELINIPGTDNYRPIFVCYPLWKSSLKECLDEPIFIQEIYNKKGLQFSIPYKDHLLLFHEVVERIKIEVPILLLHAINLNSLLEIFDKQFSNILIKSSPVGQAKLYESKLCSSLYVNDVVEITKILIEIKEASNSWDHRLFEWKFGKLNNWYQKLNITVQKRAEFLKQVEINKGEKKVSKLKSSVLTK